jgi:AraC family transcriptional regulator
MNSNTERLLPILVHIQAHLAEDLAVGALAALANLSPYHFHRLFCATVGETVKQYVQRLRLEQAAFRLKLHDAPVIDVAFGLGYHSHENFTRAFRKQFGTPPKAYRRTHHGSQSRLEATKPLPALNNALINASLSKVRIQRLEPITVAFIRHLGAYTEADAGAFDTLIAWAVTTGRYDGDNLLLGIGHDDPNITPADKVRFDACLQVNEPFAPTGVIGCQRLPAGDYAALTYVGPYGAAMYAAYAAIFAYMQRRPDYTLVGLPAVEIYRTTRVNPDYALNHTEILLPVAKKGV